MNLWRTGLPHLGRANRHSKCPERKGIVARRNPSPSQEQSADVSSLLNLQSESVTDPSTLQRSPREPKPCEFDGVSPRESCTSRTILSRIVFGQYVRELVAHLVRSYVRCFGYSRKYQRREAALRSIPPSLAGLSSRTGFQLSEARFPDTVPMGNHGLINGRRRRYLLLNRS